MKPILHFKKIWSDEDLVELEIRVSNGDSSFSNKAYVGHEELKKVAGELNAFRLQVHGGIYDLDLGWFGPEYANGAFLARFHFHNGKVYISTQQESEFFDFSKTKVSNRANMHLITVAGALDEFVKSWQALSVGKVQEASL